MGVNFLFVVVVGGFHATYHAGLKRISFFQ